MSPVIFQIYSSTASRGLQINPIPKRPAASNMHLRPSFYLCSYSLLILTTLIAASPLVLKPRQGFGDSCIGADLNLAGSVLSDDCYNESGNLVRSSVDLDYCIGNSGGNLIVRNICTVPKNDIVNNCSSKKLFSTD